MASAAAAIKRTGPTTYFLSMFHRLLRLIEGKTLVGWSVGWMLARVAIAAHPAVRMSVAATRHFAPLTAIATKVRRARHFSGRNRDTSAVDVRALVAGSLEGEAGDRL